MPKVKFTDSKLKQLVKDGLNGSQIAKRLGVSKGAISMRLKQMNAAVASNVALQSAPQIVAKELDTIAQLQKINEDANELLNRAMAAVRGEGEKWQEGKSPSEVATKCMLEIRGQLRLQVEIFQALCDVREVQRFREAVLEAIGSVAPETREAIIHKLQEMRAIRSTLDLPT